MDTISYFILKYKDKILSSDQNQIDINAFLGIDFFVPFINYSKLIRSLNSNIINMEYDLSNKRVKYNKKTDFDILKISLKIMNILSLVYKENGVEALKKVGSMNKICVDMNNEFKHSKNAFKTDIFNMIYGYD